MFILWLTKQINVFCTRLIRGVGITRFLCPPWTLGCPDYCHWATRTPWSCVCCWSQCDHQAILWIGSTDLSHFFLHGSWRTRVADSTNHRPAEGVDHRKSDSTANAILQPNAVPVSVIDAITGSRIAFWGWSFYCSCQHKGKLCWSLRERSKHGWLRKIRVVHRRKSYPPGCPMKSLWGIHNRSKYPFVAWSSEGQCWGG